MIAVFNVFLKRHKMGKAILCVSEDIPTSSLMGIPINRTMSTIYFLGGVFGVIGGVLYSSSYGAVSLGMGFQGHGGGFHRRGHRRHRQPGRGHDRRHDSGAFPKISSAFYVSSTFRDPITFLILIFILLIKPTGIMGKVEQGKV